MSLNVFDHSDLIIPNRTNLIIPNVITDVTALDRDGRNVLFYNVAGGRLDTFAYLLDNGALVREDYQRINILMEAVHHGQVNIQFKQTIIIIAN